MLDDIQVVMVLPTPGMFGVKVFADLEQVVAEYGIKVRFNSEMVEWTAPPGGHHHGQRTVPGVAAYDLLHAVPPQSAPDWLKRTPLADTANPAGYVASTRHHAARAYPEIFALGDAGSTPNSKTGAAIRKQAPVLVKNLLDVMKAHRRPSTAGTPLAR